MKTVLLKNKHLIPALGYGTWMLPKVSAADFGSEGAPVLKEQTLQSIAKKYERTPAQIALKWAIQRGTIVIPKSASESRVKENFELDDLELSEEDMQAITALDQQKIFVNPIKWWGFPYFV